MVTKVRLSVIAHESCHFGFLVCLQYYDHDNTCIYIGWFVLHLGLEGCLQPRVKLEPNFATGIRMGMGTFNLFLSLLPARVMKLLEFVGFSGEREWGIEQLEAAALSSTFRGSLSPPPSSWPTSL